MKIPSVLVYIALVLVCLIFSIPINRHIEISTIQSRGRFAAFPKNATIIELTTDRMIFPNRHSCIFKANVKDIKQWIVKSPAFREAIVKQPSKECTDVYINNYGYAVLPHTRTHYVIPIYNTSSDSGIATEVEIDFLKGVVVINVHDPNYEDSSHPIETMGE